MAEILNCDYMMYMSYLETNFNINYVFTKYKIYEINKKYNIARKQFIIINLLPKKLIYN